MTWLFLSMLITLILGAGLIRYASVWGLTDIPGERKVHSVPTPRTGGIAMVAGGLLIWLIYSSCGFPPFHIPPTTLLAGMGFIGIGAMDDRFGFHPRQKFLWFAVFALVAAWPWAFQSATAQGYPIHFGRILVLLPRWVVLPVLTLWFMSVPNAVNIEDAINGYMGGFTLILLAVFSAFGVRTQIPVGALLGFLLLNWPKAKHFMGDAGSFGCGFFIAEAGLRAGGNGYPLQLLLITAPISMDVACGLLRRWRVGMSFFAADQDTLPHHVLALCKGRHGLATLLLWANTAVFVGLSARPALALPYVAAFAGCLCWFNRTALFNPRKAVPA